MMCWNVCGWQVLGQGMEVPGDDLRTEVLKYYGTNIMVAVETWLKDEEGVINGMVITERS